MTQLTIAEIGIRQDAEGRYCLNDLHRASGGEVHHRPSEWLKNQKTQELCEEIEKDGNPSILSKQGLGTFVRKELVYAYAMWISPAFHLKVIRAYDAMVTAPSARSDIEGKAAAAVLILRAATEDLKLSQASVLGGYRRIAQSAGIPDLLPGYAVDAPTSDVAGSSEPTKSLTDLLREHGSPFSARDFNCELLYLGVIEERVRPSSKGGVKKFKVLVDMEYGKNITSPNNQRESAPHYYPSRFGELLSRVEESYF